MAGPSHEYPIDTARPIGDEPEENLAERITAELANDPDVVLMATCAANSAGHLATGISGRICHRVTEWLVDHLDRSGDVATYEHRVARWKPGSCNVQALTASIANALHDHHGDERRRRARNDAAA